VGDCTRHIRLNDRLAEANMLRVLNHDTDAMVRIFDEYAGLAYSVALGVLKQPVDAEDIVQEIFLQLWAKPELFNPRRGPFGAWLAVIARNRSISLLRKMESVVCLENVTLYSDTDVVKEVHCKLQLTRIHRVIEGLPTKMQPPLMLAYREDYSYPEIADLMGIPLGTVKTRIRYGLKAIRASVLNGDFVPLIL
jgi:RNA polymerase sigma-70 factor (ECF subfamily)